MPIPRIAVRGALLLTVGLLLVPGSLAQDVRDSKQQCVVLHVERYGSDLSASHSTGGAVGAGVSSPLPGDGVAVSAYVSVGGCQPSTSAVTAVVMGTVTVIVSNGLTGNDSPLLP